MATDLATLYLDLDEEITAVIDRIAGSDSQALTLVVPKGAALTQSIINLKLLRRAAERHKRTLTIVTRDETGQLLAQRAGFAVRASVSGPLVVPRPVAQRAPSSTIREDAAAAHQVSPEEVEDDKAELRDQSVSMRPTLRTQVEAERDVAERPRPAVRTPRRTRVLPRVARSEPDAQVGQKTTGESRVAALLARAKSRSTKQRSMQRASGVTRSKTAHGRIHLLPDLPWKKIGAGAGAALVITFMIFTFGFASASITITPKKETATVDFEVVAKQQPAAGKSEILGKPVTLSREGKKTITATGKEDKGEKAQGSVTISNAFSDKPQPFGVNTRLASASGQIFLLTAQVTVPGARVVKGKAVPGTVSVSVVAEKAGEEYNLGPTTFTFMDLGGVQREQITASSDSPMTGGSKKEVTVLTSDDVDKAGEAIKGELAPTLVSEIRSKLPAEEELVDGAWEVKLSKVQPSVAVGDEAQQVEVSVQVDVNSIVTRPSDVQSIAREELKKNVPADQELLDEAEEKVTWNKKAADFSQGKLVLAVHAEKQAAYRIDTEQLMGQLLGQTEGKAEDLVKDLPEVSSVRVHLSPFWRNNLPKSPKKVHLEVNL